MCSSFNLLRTSSTDLPRGIEEKDGFGGMRDTMDIKKLFS